MSKCLHAGCHVLFVQFCGVCESLWLMIGFFFVNRELAGYNLTGSILDSGIQNLTELTILWLENNALTESVPNLSALTKLQQL
jgi:Leucine-rich repeat (LRR) protein